MHKKFAYTKFQRKSGMEKEKIVIRRFQNGELTEKTDEVAVEQQLEIEISDGNKIKVTCTPTHIEEMVTARKFLAGIRSLSIEKTACETTHKTPEVLTGIGTAESALMEMAVPLSEIFTIAKDSFENPGSLFADTGCAHSCALIHKGEVVCCIEDIGRHNALDKVIGYALLHGIPRKKCYVFTSGRVSADYLQKVIDGGFPMVVSRAAVTDAAVALAKEKNVTLLGFIRKNTGNLYHEGAVKIY